MVFMTLFTICGIAVFAIASALFGFLGIAVGDNTSEVVLPYEPESGYIWEYDCVNDISVILTNSKTENGKQIFSFTGMDAKTNIKQGYVMDLVFTAENGETRIYYAYAENGFIYDKVIIAPAEDCVVTDYTVKSVCGNEDCKWSVDVYCKNKENILYSTDTTGTEITHTVILFPKNEKKEFGCYFECRSETAAHEEHHYVWFDFTGDTPVATPNDPLIFRDNLPVATPGELMNSNIS